MPLKWAKQQNGEEKRNIAHRIYRMGDTRKVFHGRLLLLWLLFFARFISIVIRREQKHKMLKTLGRTIVARLLQSFTQFQHFCNCFSDEVICQIYTIRIGEWNATIFEYTNLKWWMKGILCSCFICSGAYMLEKGFLVDVFRCVFRIT